RDQKRQLMKQNTELKAKLEAAEANSKKRAAEEEERKEEKQKMEADMNAQIKLLEEENSRLKQESEQKQQRVESLREELEKARVLAPVAPVVDAGPSPQSPPPTATLSNGSARSVASVLEQGEGKAVEVAPASPPTQSPPTAR